MHVTAHDPLDVNNEEFEIITELLESERARLLIEIRHTDHRAFRDGLRHRLATLEKMLERCSAPAGA